MSENEGGLDKAKNKIKAAGQGRGKGASPQWNESSKHVQTRWLLYGLIGAVVGVWVIVLNWLFTAANIANLPAKALEAGVDLTVVMAPVIAGAAGVERLLETVFNTLEGAWRTLIAYLGYGMRWLKSTETEVAEARNWLQNMGAIYNGSVAANNQQLTIMFNEHKTKLVAELKAAAALAADPRLKTFLEGTAEQTTQLPAEMLARMTDLLITPPDLPLPAELVTKVNDLRLSVLNQVEALNKQATATLTWTEAMLKDAEKRLQAAEDKLAGATSSRGMRQNWSSAPTWSAAGSRDARRMPTAALDRLTDPAGSGLLTPPRPAGSSPLARADVDLRAVQHNVQVLRVRAGVPLMAVVKADAFGHGAVPVAKAAVAAGATWLGVCRLDEALALRSAGLRVPILAWLDDMAAVAPAAARTAGVDVGQRQPDRSGGRTGRRTNRFSVRDGRRVSPRSSYSADRHRRQAGVHPAGHRHAAHADLRTVGTRQASAPPGTHGDDAQLRRLGAVSQSRVCHRGHSQMWIVRRW